jgi:hypothetical protein
MCIWNVKSTNIYRSEKCFEQTLQRHLEHKFHVRYVFDLSFTVFDMIKQQIANANIYLFIYTTTHCSLKAYCAIWVRRSNFRHQASLRVSPRESTQRRKVELWARNVR